MDEESKTRDAGEISGRELPGGPGGTGPDLLRPKEAAAYLRISLFALRKIEQQGLIVPRRTPGGHRRYSKKMLNRYRDKLKG
jgi:hypothetical protein